MTSSAVDHSEGFEERSVKALRNALYGVRIAVLAPAPSVLPADWSEEHVTLSKQTSNKAGRLKLFPYQRDLLNMMVEPGAEVVSIMKSARVGYTQLLALLIAYYLEHKATPILSVFPVKQDARYFEKTYIRPLLKGTEVLREIIPDFEDQQWDSKVTLRGSSLEMHQAEKYDTFRAFNADLAAGDEVDAPSWAPGKGEGAEGDKTALLINRVETFDDGRALFGSTPTVEGRSQIKSLFMRGDQRYRFVPCPHCGEYQVLEWGGRDTMHGIKWPQGKPSEAYYVCKHNGCVIEESDKVWMDERGEFRPTAKGETGKISAQICSLYSQMKKASWGRLAEEFIEATRLAKEENNKERLKAFVNTKLGETWKDYEEEKGLKKPHELGRLCQVYQAPVPPGVKFLTAGVDTQSGKKGSGGYFVPAIWGWGVREKPILIAHWILNKPVESAQAWQELADILMAPYAGADGRDHYVQAACIDTGGDYQQAVVDFCATWRQKHPMGERWLPIKGWSAGGGKRGPKIWKTPFGKQNKSYDIDVDLAKDALFRKIHSDPSAIDSLVMPAAPLAGSLPCDNTFFEGLTAEKKEYVAGTSSWIWKGKKGNEPSDCLTYAFAGVQFLKTLPMPNPYIAALDAPLEPVIEGEAVQPAAVAPRKKKRRGVRLSRAR